MVHHQTVDPTSQRERLLLVAQQGNDVSEFHVAPRQYLEKLVTKVEEEETQKPPLPSNVLSMTELRTMTLGDQIRALMINAKVMKFSQLMALLTKGTDPTSALRCLQQVALMVQGCWVVKSDVLYPKDSLSPHSGVCTSLSEETLCFTVTYLSGHRFLWQETFLHVYLSCCECKTLITKTNRNSMQRFCQQQCNLCNATCGQNNRTLLNPC